MCRCGRHGSCVLKSPRWHWKSSAEVERPCTTGSCRSMRGAASSRARRRRRGRRTVLPYPTWRTPCIRRCLQRRACWARWRSGGLITRRQDPTDRRKTRVTLTDAGERERARGRDLLQEFASLIADDFGAERLGAFAAEAGQLAGAMQRALAVMEERHPELASGNPPFPPHPPFRDMDARCDKRRE